tara:strand:- start:3111 stop:3434 length:324 start_codon:yes stop_codon:yes gene_type:complete
MKKLPVFLVIMSLVVGSLFSAMHAHAGSVADRDVQIIKSMDDNSGDDIHASQQVKFHQCVHSDCSHIALNQQSKSHNSYHASQKYFMSSGESYLSQLNSPPFQPPRA